MAVLGVTPFFRYEYRNLPLSLTNIEFGTFDNLKNQHLDRSKIEKKIESNGCNETQGE